MSEYDLPFSFPKSARRPDLTNEVRDLLDALADLRRSHESEALRFSCDSGRLYWAAQALRERLGYFP